MSFQERWYQNEAVDATIDYIEEKPFGHPLVVMPTGSGKSPTLCKIIDRLLSKDPSKNVLVLSHVAEILEQDHAALERYFEGYEVGLFSAGLDSKTIKKITVAGIQSVYNMPEKFMQFDYIIIDECHRIPVRGNGMYLQFLKALEHAIYIGLTATHFRLGHGYIHKGKGALFTDIAYDLSEFEKFNRLVNEGYLSKLITKRTLEEFQTDGIKKTGGDFNLKELSSRFDRDSITEAAVNEIITIGKNFKKWLVFSIDIKHAEHIANEFNRNGISAVCVHSKLKRSERRKILKDYKAGAYRVIVNVDILTTGFDVPDIDLIGILRPTDSPSLHVQIVGRGLRVVFANGYDINTIEGRLAAIKAGPKPHGCLVLDFAGNTKRLGPINDIKIKQKGERQEGGEPITKECPECGVIQHPSVRVCDVCGHEFEFKQKIIGSAHTDDIIKEEKKLKEWHDVSSVEYSIHQKKGSPSSLRVSYQIGMLRFSEWVAIDSHKPFVKQMAQRWIKFRWIGFKEELPRNLNELYKKTELLRKPKRILVNNSGKFPTIDDYIF